MISSGVYRGGRLPDSARLAVFLIVPDHRGQEVTAGKRLPQRSAAIDASRVHLSMPGANPIPVAPNAPSSDSEARVDWNAEAARAAEDAARGPAYTRSFGMPESSDAKPNPREEFGWSHAHTHRVEPLPDGGFVLNITDRCAIVFVLIPLPFCRIGTIPVRGDLFQHIHDPPQPGDWKDTR
jgi:hypothetical protein